MKINVCPSHLIPGHSGYSPTALSRLFGSKSVSPYLDFDFDKDVTQLEVSDNVGRISLSGIQEKMGAVIDRGRIRLSRVGERSTHILKPAPFDYGLIARRQIPANEHLTMQIASQVYRIATAENGLCFDAKGHTAYITKRFDIMDDGRKVKMEDFAVLCARNEQTEGKYFKYSGCYEDIAIAIKRFMAAWPGATRPAFVFIDEISVN